MDEPTPPPPWSRVKELFEAARELPADRRSTHLAELTGSDAALRLEVESLLAAYERADQFLEKTAAETFVHGGMPALLEGRDIGPYHLSARIGVGGMGDVYRARDTRLGRTVAVKVLPAQGTVDSQAHQRFEREARAVAALNHPNICTLFDIGSQDSIDFLVMEFLEGETLSARLANGPLPLDQALEYAVQIASALDRAHRSGIVHRDLKPGNIMVTKSGVKLLDFGIAKAPAFVTGAADPGGRDLTGAGIVMGTPQYMAPEQLEGRAVDTRADLFAFGAVLYEMLTGRKAFDAPSTARLIAAILSTEPTHLDQLDPSVPHFLDYIVSRCLAKDPDDRWQTARDLLAELKRPLDTRTLHDRTAKASPPHAAPASRFRFAGVVGIAATIVAIALFVAIVPRTRSNADATWLSILPPVDGFDLSPDPTVSPDGRYIAYKAQDASHRTQIWLKPLAAAEARPIPGTEGTDLTFGPFWSPDSAALGFFAQGKLKRIGIDGGTAQVLANAPEPRGGTWTPSGVIVFNADTQNLVRVPASGGQALRVEGPAGVRLFPHALPDGRHYLFTSRDVDGQGQGVYVASIDATDVRRIADAWSPAKYAGGHLLFVRQKGLFAQRFNLDRLEPVDEPQQIADGVGVGYGTPLSFSFSASPNVVTYWSGSSRPLGRLTWFDRSGKRLATIDEPGVQDGVTVSRDGRRAVVERLDTSRSTTDIWLLDPQSGTGASRLTSDGRFSVPVLSPDGRRLALMERGRGIVTMAMGSETTDLIVPGPSSKWPSSWSTDGRLLAFADSTPTTWRLWTTKTEPGTQATIFREAPFALAAPEFSPDGSALAYSSDESGRVEVYVDAYPTPGTRVRVSAAGGSWPKWRRDGKELYFLAPDRKLMAAAISGNGSGLIAAPAQVLFETPGVNPDATRSQFEPSGDGSRFLLNARIESATPVGLTVISNWTALMRR